jgi:hypothetical protein
LRGGSFARRRMPNPAFIFGFELVGHSVAFEVVAYVGVCVLVSMLFFAAQMKNVQFPRYP